MWMKSRLISSIFSSLFGDSGHLIKMSIISRKFTNTEWFSFRSSFFLSISFAEYKRLKPCKDNELKTNEVRIRVSLKPEILEIE